MRGPSFRRGQPAVPERPSALWQVPDPFLHVVRVRVLDQENPGLGPWPPSLPPADQEPSLDAGGGRNKADAMSHGLTSRKADFVVVNSINKFGLSLQIVDLQLQHI